MLHPAAEDERQVATFVARWLREEALRLLAPRVAEFAARVTTDAPTLKLSNARSEWGSCNQHGVIRLNWRLVQLPPDLARYIVAHEVAHLVELNHSPRFWSLVETLFPGHAEARRTLDDWTALARSVASSPPKTRARCLAFPVTIRSDVPRSHRRLRRRRLHARRGRGDRRRPAWRMRSQRSRSSSPPARRRLRRDGTGDRDARDAAPTTPREPPADAACAADERKP